MRLKTILMTLLGLVAALAIAAVVFVLTMDFDQYRPVIAEKVREATGRELEIRGSLDLKLSLTPAITVDDVRFANAPWGSRPDMVRLKSLRVEVELLPLLTGDIEIKRFVLIGPDILLETDAKGRGNWILPGLAKAPAKAKEEGEFTLPTIRDVRIEDARLSYRDGATGKTTKIALTSLTARAEGANAPLEVEIIGAVDKTGFEITAVLGPLKALGGDGPWPVELNARVLGAVIKAKGKVISPLKKPEFDIALSVEGKDLGGLAALAGAPLPPGPYRLKARLKGGAQSFALEGIDAGIGSSDLGGKASFVLSGPRPAISADLSSSLIDLADFTPPETAKKAGAKKAGEAGKKAARKRLFSADPLPLAALGAVDADIKIRVKRILAKKIVLSDVAVDLTLKDGKLTVRPLKAVLAKGVITGNFELDTRGKTAKVTVMLSVKKLDIAALLKEMDLEALASGQIDFYTRLRGTGNSVQTIMAGAGGRLNIVSGGARVNSKYVDLLGADLLQMATSTGNTRVNCLVARFDIANGLAKDRGILFDTERMSVRGEGTINLGTEALDLKFTPKPKDASLINLAVPWRVRGTLLDPSVGPDEASVVKEAAGLLIFGPLALLGSMATTGTGDQNPCVAALEAKPASAKTGTTQKQPATEEKKGGIEGFFEGIGKSLQGIFGN
ncbi:MAG: AsmA family protein [Proteobacteria bacterium]|nr:AsmA family protein [Pseudomonadota bacterium]